MRISNTRRAEARARKEAVALLVLATALLPWGGVRADDASAAEFFRAQLVASSAAARASRAADASVRTAWCPAASDARGEWVVEFPQPVVVRALSLYAGRMDPTRLGAEAYRPAPVVVAWDGGEAMLAPEENGQNALEVPGVAGRSTTRLVVRVAPAPGRDRCLSEVDLQLEQGPWLYGLPPEAAAALPHAVEALTGALQACDPAALRRLADFPLPVRKLQGEHGTLARLHAPRGRTYRHVRALAEDCRWLVVPADDPHGRRPHVMGSVGGRSVRVWANAHAGVRYWQLTWDRRRWRLVGVDAAEFE